MNFHLGIVLTPRGGGHVQNKSTSSRLFISNILMQAAVVRNGGRRFLCGFRTRGLFRMWCDCLHLKLQPVNAFAAWMRHALLICFSPPVNASVLLIWIGHAVRFSIMDLRSAAEAASSFWLVDQFKKWLVFPPTMLDHAAPCKRKVHLVCFVVNQYRTYKTSTLCPHNSVRLSLWSYKRFVSDVVRLFAPCSSTCFFDL
jgi:hypothetical protein